MINKDVFQNEFLHTHAHTSMYNYTGSKQLSASEGIKEDNGICFF